MDLHSRSVALYGRFSPGQREHLAREIAARGGAVARDLTRRSDYFVVGALATALIDSGSLGQRLKTARERRIPIMGERSLSAILSGEAQDEPTLPIATALGPTSLTIDDASILAAFDLITLKGEYCRFADAQLIRTAAELKRQHRSRADIVRILSRARALAPVGRHKIVLTDAGDAALQWDNGLTTLEGQGVLPLDAPQTGVDELFEEAELSEAEGEHESAARLYDVCAGADRTDPIAPFNLGNIRLAQEKNDEAVNAYQRALARDPEFLEARYNLAIAFEALGRTRQAAEELVHVLALDPAYPDANFNLAQLHMKAGNFAEAKRLYEHYLALDPPADWAATARKAITYCSAQLSRPTRYR